MEVTSPRGTCVVLSLFWFGVFRNTEIMCDSVASSRVMTALSPLLVNIMPVGCRCCEQ
jgi:hypothetical protein